LRPLWYICSEGEEVLPAMTDIIYAEKNEGGQKDEKKYYIDWTQFVDNASRFDIYQYASEWHF